MLITSTTRSARHNVIKKWYICRWLTVHLSLAILPVVFLRSIFQKLPATNNVSVFRFSPTVKIIFIRRSMRFIIFVDSFQCQTSFYSTRVSFPPLLPIPATILVAECCLAFLLEFLLMIEIAFVLPSTSADRWKWTIKRSTSQEACLEKCCLMPPQKAVAFKTRRFL